MNRTRIILVTAFVAVFASFKPSTAICADNDTHIRPSIQAIKDYSQFSYDELARNSSNLNNAELEILLTRLNHEIRNLPDSAQYIKTDLRHIDLLIQLVVPRLGNPDYYSAVVALDVLAGRKLYSHPLYMEIWIYQFTHSYLVARSQFHLDKRNHEKAVTFFKAMEYHIQSYMKENKRQGTVAHEESLIHYERGLTLSTAREFIYELTYFQPASATSNILTRPTNFLISNDHSPIFSDDKNTPQQSFPINSKYPSMNLDLCQKLFITPSIYMPERASSKRLN